MGIPALSSVVFLTIGGMALAQAPAKASPRRIAEVGVIFSKLKRTLKPRGGAQERQLREIANAYSRSDFENLEKIVGTYFEQGEGDQIPFQYKVAAVRAVLDFCVARREYEDETRKESPDGLRLAELREEMMLLEAELKTMSQQAQAFRQISMSE